MCILWSKYNLVCIIVDNAFDLFVIDTYTMGHP